MTHTRIFSLIPVALIVVATCAPAAHAQNALGDGRTLDNNLQKGSGGYNSRQPDQRLQYGAYQDAIVTGNVTGLARFRGGVGYRAPGEFSGRLPSNDTYRFELDSRPNVPINPYQAQQLGLSAESWRGADNRVTTRRSGVGASIGDISQPADAESRVLRSDVSALLTSTNAAAGTLDSTLLNVQRQTVGVTADAQGNVGRIEASPLVGLRMVPVTPAPITPMQRAARLDAEEPGDTEDEGPEDRQTSPRLDVPTVENPPVVDRPGGVQVADGDDPRLNDRLDPALRIDGRPASEAPANVSLNWVDAKPGEDVYMDMLRSTGQLVDPDKPADDADDAAKVVRAPRTQVQKILDDFDKPDPEAEEAARKAAEEKLIQALTAAVDKGGPRQTTLAGNGGTAYDRTMLEAERLLGEGKYFKAEAEYIKAMRMKPGQPMALVGRIHSQIGAGLFLSAGTNLRNLLSVFPELMATRYAGGLLPQGERKEKVRQALTASLKGEPRPEIHLLAAYIAFQEGDAELAGRALDTAEKGMPNDRLIKLASAVWTRPQPDAPEDDAEGDADPKPEKE